jgi:hypothetical protein
MQLTPVTMREMKLPEDASHSQMLHGGAKYMARLLKRYNDDLDLALAAYNAGPGNVAKYNGVPPFKETQNYIAKVKAAMASSKFTKKSSVAVAATARLRLTAAGNVDLRGIDLWLGAHVARAMMNPEGLSAGLNKVFGPADATVFGKPAHTMYVQDIADGQLKLTEPILRTPQADAWLRNTRIAIVDGEHVNGDRGGYSPERNVLVIYPRAYQNIDGVTATITHELRHAADAGYNPLNIQKQVDAMQQLSNRKDLSKTEQNRRYMQLDTELKSFVGNMARRLVNDLGPHALEMLNVPDVWPPEAKQIYDLVDGRNRPKFMTRVYKEVQSLLAAEGLV